MVFKSHVKSLRAHADTLVYGTQVASQVSELPRAAFGQDLEQLVTTMQFFEAEYFDSGRRSSEGRTLLLWLASAPIDFDMPQGHGRLRRHS